MNLLNQFPNRLLGNLDEIISQTLRSFDPTPESNAADTYRYESDEAYRLRLDLPGFNKEEVDLKLEEDQLTVSAKTEREEAFRDDFERTYTLPEDVDPDGITAKLENGVLELTLNRIAPEEPKTRSIEID